MPNWKKIIVSGSDASLNTLNVTNGITGSLFGTASYAISSSYAISASNAISSVNTSDILIYVKNLSGNTITKGSVVKIIDSVGDNALITTASYESDITSANTLGILNETIANDSFGYAMTEGTLIGISTDTYTAGQLLFLGPTGSIIGYEPAAPLHAVRLGQALRIQPVVGSMYVRIDNGYELDELHNVLIISGSDGDLLVASGSNDNGKKLYINSKQLTGSYGLTGSLNVTGGSITSNLIGTSSWSTNSINANTASYVNTLNQTLQVSGALELKPIQDPDPTSANFNSSYFFVSSSGDNTKFNLHYRNNGNLWETHWLEERADTGLVWGGVTTFSGSTIYVTPGAGLIINHNATTGSHGDTHANYIEFGAITASSTYITSSQVTYLLINAAGELEQQLTPYTTQQYNEKFPLGYIFNFTTSSISSFADARNTSYGQDDQQSQFIKSFGPLKIRGFDITPQTGSLKITVASGTSYRYGGFYSQNPDAPSTYESPTILTGSLIRAYRDPAAIGGYKAETNGGLPYSDIDPTKWDNGTGTLQTVGSTEWTIQRAYQGAVNGVTYVYYGPAVYDSLNSAVQAISTEAFTEAQVSIIALPFIGYIITRGNTTDLGDTVNNRIIQAGLFRNTAGSSGGGAAATTVLSDISDVTLTSPINGQSLIYDAGVWINAIPVTASYAQTASHVTTLIQDVTITGSLAITGNITSTSGNTISNDALLQASLLYLSNNF